MFDRRVLCGLVVSLAALGVGLASAGGAWAGQVVYVTNPFGGLGVSQYGASSGVLSPLSPFSVASAGQPGGIAVAPDVKNVYVPGNPDTVSQYTINQTTGELNAKFPFTVTTGMEPGAIAVSSDSRSVYVVTQNGVWEYTIDSTTGELSPKTPAAIPAGSGSDGIALSPDGRSVYVTNSASNTVSQYNVDPTNEGLRHMTPAVVATGRGPAGIAASGNSVYVVNIGGTSVSQYTIDPTTGTLSPKSPATIALDGSNPDAIAVSPDGRSAYVTGTFDGAVSQFTIDPTTGLLSRKTPSSVPDGGPNLAVTPDGKSAYLTHGNLNTVSQYAINPTTGTLSPETPATVASGGSPWEIVVAPVGTCPKVFGGCNVGIQLEGGAATITSTLLAAGTVGILVQRILGRQLVTIGRVPLGRHRVGRVRLRWNLRVNGHTLPPGHYLITLRALGASGQVIALTAPVKITIHPKKHGHG